MEQGDEIEEDVSCNSSYVEEAMERLGDAARSIFWWVPSGETMFLVMMDNNVGHGTDAAIARYTELKHDYNIEIIFQTPRSPFLNLLDLGVWCSVQAKVEARHNGKGYNTKSLARSVEEAWNNDKLAHVIRKVNTGFLKVLDLVILGRGSNRHVESRRGKDYEKFDNNEQEAAFLQKNAGLN